MKENYPIALCSYYLFTYKCVEHGAERDIDSAYGAYIQ